MHTLSIIIPVFNESKTIILLLDKIKAVKLNADLSKDIIVIDDGSTDNSHDLILGYIQENKSLNIRLIAHKINKGKG